MASQVHLVSSTVEGSAKAVQENTLAPPEEDLGNISSDWESGNDTKPKQPDFKSLVKKDGKKKKAAPNLTKFQTGNKVCLNLGKGKTSEPYTIKKVHSGGKYDLQNAAGKILERINEDEFVE